MQLFFQVFLMFFRGVDPSSRENLVASIVRPLLVTGLFISMIAIVGMASAAGS